MCGRSLLRLPPPLLPALHPGKQEGYKYTTMYINIGVIKAET